MKEEEIRSFGKGVEMSANLRFFNYSSFPLDLALNGPRLFLEQHQFFLSSQRFFS